MKPTSARALAGLAAIAVIIGWTVISPSGAFLVFVLAAILAVIPAIFGSERIRILAIVLLLAALSFAVIKYPEFRKDQEVYRAGALLRLPAALHSTGKIES